MLSTDLAELYGVEPRALVQAVKRNRERFPEDFMFQLKKIEFENLKSQIMTSSWGGLRRTAPYAFTEQGVAMLSSVLRSRRAIQVNITIMRAFVSLRAMVVANKTFANTLAELEHKVASHDGHIRSLFEAIRQLMSAPSSSERRIGFEVKSGKTPANRKDVSDERLVPSQRTAPRAVCVVGWGRKEHGQVRYERRLKEGRE